MSARFCQDYVLRGTPEDCFNAIHQLLTARGFNYTTYENEQVFQHGTGWIAAPTFFKITFGQGTVRVETWMKYAVLPGVYAGELGMEGFVGCAVKGKMKDATIAIDQMLGGSAARIGCDPFLAGKNMTGAPQPLPQTAPAQIPQYAAPQQPQYAAPPQPVYQQPQYAAPQQPVYQQPQYAAPQQPVYQQPQYAAPQQPAYQQPQYAAPQQLTNACRGCGATLAPGTVFCPNCGARN